MLKHDETRQIEFGSMTARKDDSSPIKSIFCHKRPQNNAMKYYSRQQKSIQDHNRSLEAMLGPISKVLYYLAYKASYVPMISSLSCPIANWEQFSRRTFFVRY